MVESYEDLMNLVENRRNDHLIIEVSLGAPYSQEHEDAKAELQKAEAMRSIIGEEGFLSDDVSGLKKRVEDTKPEGESIWVKYKRLDLKLWTRLVSGLGAMKPIDQYVKVLPNTFEGVYSSPEAEDGSLISDKASLVDPTSNDCILSGNMVMSLVGAFMGWQNSGGDVSIRPTT